QMTFYQDNFGDVWLTGTYQWGFNDPSSWGYDWSIRNGCDDVIFNLTDWLHMEFAADSGCYGYDNPSKKGHKRINYLDKRHNGNKCIIGKWGTKPWVVKVSDLTWDCEDQGFKHKICVGKDIYKDMVTVDDDKKPSRMKDEGNTTGLYLVIVGQSNDGKHGKRDTTTSAASINIDNEGGTVVPQQPPPTSNTPPAPATTTSTTTTSTPATTTSTTTTSTPATTTSTTTTPASTTTTSTTTTLTSATTTSSSKITYTPAPSSTSKITHTPVPSSTSKITYTPVPSSTSKITYPPVPSSTSKITYPPQSLSIKVIISPFIIHIWTVTQICKVIVIGQMNVARLFDTNLYLGSNSYPTKQAPILA
ncbi:3699_t:CDS:2, partial [Dentiscutata heterogama]